MTDQTEREALEALWRKVNGQPAMPDGPARIRSTYYRFRKMLDAGAYLDAALMVVPEGVIEFGLSRSRMSLDMGGKNWKCLVGKHRASGRTPALALCAAVEAAIAREGE